MNIIAEAGINHNGSMELAKQLVDVAKRAGADLVKFQTFWDLPGLKQYEFTESQWWELKAYCDNQSICFLSTPFCEKSANLLNEMGVWAFKVSSGKCRDKNFLSLLLGFKRPLIISLGMTTDYETYKLTGWIKEKMHQVHHSMEETLLQFSRMIVLMHCRSEYPLQEEKAGLGRIAQLKEEFLCPVGFSDHSRSISNLPMMAAALGVSFYEKHLTLDRTMEGPDHAMSLEPVEFEMMVSSIRHAEKCLAIGPEITEAEWALRKKLEAERG